MEKYTVYIHTPKKKKCFMALNQSNSVETLGSSFFVILLKYFFFYTLKKKVECIYKLKLELGIFHTTLQQNTLPKGIFPKNFYFNQLKCCCVMYVYDIFFCVVFISNVENRMKQRIKYLI